MKGKQTSMVLEEIGQFAARQLDIPAIRSDEALLRVEMTGVCRTDASFYQGKTRPHLIPLILGHEILGHIAEIGEEAAQAYGVREGDRVVVESSIRCGRCPLLPGGQLSTVRQSPLLRHLHDPVDSSSFVGGLWGVPLSCSRFGPSPHLRVGPG